MKFPLRVARPTDNLVQLAAMYQKGLGLDVLGSYEDHDDFDGIMLGKDGASYHFEFTHHRRHSVGKAPTKDNLIVFYIPDHIEWDKTCAKMRAAGFKSVPSYNPYWDEDGCTFEDMDGYRVVLSNTAWG